MDEKNRRKYGEYQIKKNWKTTKGKQRFANVFTARALSNILAEDVDTYYVFFRKIPFY